MRSSTPAVQETIAMIEIKTSLYFTVYSTYTGVTTSKSIPLAYFYVKPLKPPLVTARIQALGPPSLIQIYASADHRFKCRLAGKGNYMSRTASCRVEFITGHGCRDLDIDFSGN
jgi:hypothetical protein